MRTLYSKRTSGLYYKCFTIITYNHKGTLQFAVYLVVVIYDPRED